MNYCLHHSDPTICKVCNRPKEELVWKQTDEDHIEAIDRTYSGKVQAKILL